LISFFPGPGGASWQYFSKMSAALQPLRTSVRLSHIVSESARYAAQVGSRPVRLLLLWIAAAIPVVDIIVLGYMVRVARHTPFDADPPRLVRPFELFADGVVILVVLLVYLLGGMIVAAAFYLLGSIPGAAFGLAIAALGYSFVPLACLAVLAQGELSGAFDIPSILRRVARIGVARYYAWMGLGLLLILLVGAQILYLKVWGLWLAALLWPLIGVFVARGTALMYAYSDLSLSGEP